MAYVSTQASGGLGSTFEINGSGSGAGSPAAWIPLGEIRSMKPAGAQVKSDDATNLQSAAEEFIPMIFTGGTYELAMNRSPLDPGFIEAQVYFKALTTVQCRVTLKKAPGQATVGDRFTFLAFVEKFMHGTVEPTKIIQMETTFKVTGDIVETPGS